MTKKTEQYKGVWSDKMPDSKTTPPQPAGQKPSSQQQSESSASPKQPEPGKVIRDWASI